VNCDATGLIFDLYLVVVFIILLMINYIWKATVHCFI